MRQVLQCSLLVTFCQNTVYSQLHTVSHFLSKHSVQPTAHCQSLSVQTQCTAHCTLVVTFWQNTVYSQLHTVSHFMSKHSVQSTAHCQSLSVKTQCTANCTLSKHNVQHCRKEKGILLKGANIAKNNS
jgi:hypothetical protein